MTLDANSYKLCRIIHESGAEFVTYRCMVLFYDNIVAVIWI